MASTPLADLLPPGGWCVPFGFRRAYPHMGGGDMAGPRYPSPIEMGIGWTMLKYAVAFTPTSEVRA
eukprot:9300118-Pyramimonas_sp.AAC.1